MTTTIYNSIIALNLPSDVQEEAFKLLEKYYKTVFEGKHCNTIVFFVVYESYRKLKKVFDPIELGEKNNIGSKHINDKLKQFYRKGIPFNLVNYTPKDFIPEYAIYANIPLDEYEEIEKIIDKLYSKYPIYKEKCPNVIGAVVIVYYAYIKGYISDKKKFIELIHKCSKKSISMITDIENKIEDIDCNI